MRHVGKSLWSREWNERREGIGVGVGKKSDEPWRG
jgi:hypothetical protein